MGPALRIEAGCYTERPPRRRTAGPSGLERRLDPLGQAPADARHGRDLLDRRLADPLDRAEHLEQLALALRPDARQVVERRPDGPLGAQVAVVGDREPVRLVAQALDEVQGRVRSAAAGSGRRDPAGTAPRAPWRDRPAAGRAGPSSSRTALAALTWPLPPSTITRSGIAQRRSSSLPSSPAFTRPEPAAQDLLVAGEVVRALRPSGSGTGGTRRSAACRPRRRPCCRPIRCPGSC